VYKHEIKRDSVAIMKEKSEQNKLYDHITGAILAGGSSTRYGKNKAFLKIGGVRLIDNMVQEMKSIFQRVILIANEKKKYEYLEVEIFEDLVKGFGPLGGIYTGLMSISNQAGFFVACDMPRINRQLVRYMVDIKGDHRAVVPAVADNIEPLHAIYFRSCLRPIKHLIDSKRCQVRLFYDAIPVRYVKEDEIRTFCCPSKAFLNVNTPDEFAKIKSLINP
jgi:molybdopterin-guanine dinucleotide biosynthesis protein A